MRPAPQRTGTGYRVKGSWAAGYHTGIDILCPTGTTLVAPVTSKIIHVGWGGWGQAYGIHVIGECTVNGRRYRWITAHMKSTSVKVGTTVKIGQKIGISDNTGNTTGPHCHFEVRVGTFAYGSDVNPDILLRVTDTISTDKMDPKAYFLGAHGTHITWLGERLVLHGFGKHYTTGPGPTFTEVDMDNVRDAQLAQGFRGDDADGLPGLQTLRFLAADPTAPVPLPQLVSVTSVTQNMAGNNATGIKTAKKRVANYCAARKATPVDMINVQECTVASGVRPGLDTGLKPLGYVRRNGGKGRYQYPRNSVKVIASGLITVSSKYWYKKDDKQASWTVYEKDGARGMDVSLHLESESGAEADRIRVLQAKNISAQALEKQKQYNVPIQNVALLGDTNSIGMVVTALEEIGWYNAARNTKYLNTYTFMGWDGKSRKRFDYCLVRKELLKVEGAEAKVVAVSHDTDIADHGGLRMKRHLVKEAA